MIVAGAWFMINESDQPKRRPWTFSLMRLVSIFAFFFATMSSGQLSVAVFGIYWSAIALFALVFSE